jgi:hypothetical protein
MNDLIKIYVAKLNINKPKMLLVWCGENKSSFLIIMGGGQSELWDG